MKYGEEYKTRLVNRITGESFPVTLTYKFAQWHEYTTDNEGYGLWCGDRQILGTCQFSVAGCKTEKAAIAKIRRHFGG